MSKVTNPSRPTSIVLRDLAITSAKVAAQYGAGAAITQAATYEVVTKGFLTGGLGAGTGLALAALAGKAFGKDIKASPVATGHVVNDLVRAAWFIPGNYVAGVALATVMGVTAPTLVGSTVATVIGTGGWIVLANLVKAILDDDNIEAGKAKLAKAGEKVAEAGKKAKESAAGGAQKAKETAASAEEKLDETNKAHGETVTDAAKKAEEEAKKAASLKAEQAKVAAEKEANKGANPNDDSVAA